MLITENNFIRAEGVKKNDPSGCLIRSIPVGSKDHKNEWHSNEVSFIMCLILGILHVLYEEIILLATKFLCQNGVSVIYMYI